MVKSLSSDSRKSAFGEAARRSLETCSAGRAGAHRAAPDARERIPALAEWLGPIISAVYTCYFGDRTLGPPTGSFSRAKQLNHSNACTHHTSFSKTLLNLRRQTRRDWCGCVCEKPHRLEGHRDNARSRFFKRPQVGRIEADLMITNNDNRIFS